MTNSTKLAATIGISALSIVTIGCGGSDDSDGSDGFDVLDADEPDGADDDEGSDEDLEEFADAINEATGAGGGGMLVFEGAEYPIESAVCMLDGPRIDIGTVGNGYRVFVTGDPDDLNLQILGPETQWFDGSRFPDGPESGQATIDGKIVTGAENVWWNNQDDREIMASFVIECP